MKVRYLNESDYDTTLCKWWSDWRWTPPSKDMLPENGSGGIMVYKDDVEICAGFIFFTNSKAAWVEFIVSNFDYKEKDRSEAITMVINTLTIIAQEKGYKFIYTSLKNKNLIEKYKMCGYIMADSNCQEMIKVL
jgi:hypothetical protein